MSERPRLSVITPPETELDRVALLAGAMGPPPIDDAQARAIAREALLVGRARAARGRTRQRVTWSLLAAAATIVISIASASFFVQPPEIRTVVSRLPAPPPIVIPAAVPETPTVSIGTRHHLVPEPGARFDVQSPERIEVLERAVLFEVAPLAATEHFRVHAADVDVDVVGTVFVVARIEDRVAVRVYQGTVRISDPQGSRLLSAPGTFDTSSNAPALDDGPLQAALAQALARHTANPIAAAPSRPLLGLAQARAMVAAGDHATVLRAIDQHRVSSESAAEWAFVEGDARRAALDHRGAARAYQRSAASAAPSRGAVAGYLGAVEWSRAGDHAAAIALLERSDASAQGSPTEQAALALYAQELAAQGRSADARTAARRYLVAFPSGYLAPEMEQIVRTP